jgi:hypothetical protein
MKEVILLEVKFYVVVLETPIQMQLCFTSVAPVNPFTSFSMFCTQDTAPLWLILPSYDGNLL